MSDCPNVRDNECPEERLSVFRFMRNGYKPASSLLRHCLVKIRSFNVKFM